MTDFSNAGEVLTEAGVLVSVQGIIDEAVEQASNGGSSSAVNSWLVAVASSARTTTGSFSLALNGNEGDDINIDGDDDTVINIVTPGFYAVTVAGISVVGDATGAGFVNLSFSGTVDDDPACWLYQGTNRLGRYTVTPPSFSWEDVVSLAPFKVTAPVTLTLTCNIAASAGAITVGGNIAVAVVRTG